MKTLYTLLFLLSVVAAGAQVPVVIDSNNLVTSGQVLKFFSVGSLPLIPKTGNGLNPPLLNPFFSDSLSRPELLKVGPNQVWDFRSLHKGYNDSVFVFDGYNANYWKDSVDTIYGCNRNTTYLAVPLRYKNVFHYNSDLLRYGYYPIDYQYGGVVFNGIYNCFVGFHYFPNTWVTLGAPIIRLPIIYVDIQSPITNSYDLNFHVGYTPINSDRNLGTQTSVNEVQGWGTILLPDSISFPVLKVKRVANRQLIRYFAATNSRDTNYLREVSYQFYSPNQYIVMQVDSTDTVMTHLSYRQKVRSTVSNRSTLPRPTITLFPNPSRGQLQVQHLGQWAVLEIFDLQGRQLRSYQRVASREPLNLGQLPAGLYQVRVQVDGVDAKPQMLRVE